jgi:hypothetical protein
MKNSRNTPNPGFRQHYQDGPELWYRAHGEEYRNPHEVAVRAAIDFAIVHWPEIDFSRSVDLAAGSGEATLAIAHHFPKAEIEGHDPFTAAAYRERTGKPCQPTTFEQLALGEVVLTECSCIVVSCALHLAGDSWLPSLCLALAQSAPELLVITPVTRPSIRAEWGWSLRGEQAVLCEGKNVRLRWYRRVPGLGVA